MQHACVRSVICYCRMCKQDCHIIVVLNSLKVNNKSILNVFVEGARGANSVYVLHMSCVYGVHTT